MFVHGARLSLRGTLIADGYPWGRRIRWRPYRALPVPDVAMTPEMELRLLGLARTGDDQAFTEIVHAFTPMVYRVAANLLKDPEEARDVVQEVFIAVHKALPDFEGRSSLRTWLYQVALNRARNHRRWWKVRFFHRTASLEDRSDPDGPTLGETLPDAGRGASAGLEQRELRGALAKALAALRPEFREAIVLRDVEGLSYEEIASVTNANAGTVKSRIARGRAILKEALQPFMGDPS